MHGLTRLACAAFAVLLLNAAPQPANAAFAPSPIGSALEKAAVPQTEQVRGGHRGGGRGFGMRGGGRHFGGFRGGSRWGYDGGRRSWGHRRGWRGPAWGLGIGAPLGYYGYSCIRRGWVWNGYRYVWRRYRVC